MCRGQLGELQEHRSGRCPSAQTSVFSQLRHVYPTVGVHPEAQRAFLSAAAVSFRPIERCTMERRCVLAIFSSSTCGEDGVSRAAATSLLPLKSGSWLDTRLKAGARRSDGWPAIRMRWLRDPRRDCVRLHAEWVENALMSGLTGGPCSLSWHWG